MARKRFARVLVRRPDLRGPFPKRFAARLIGETALAVQRRAKYLLVPLSSGDTLVMHLGMSGWFTVTRAGTGADSDPHDHVVFEMSSGHVVTFNDPRRFGFMDLLSPRALKAQVGNPHLELVLAEGSEDAAGIICEKFGKPLPAKDGKVLVELEGGAADVARVVLALDEGGITVESLELVEPTLDDVFVAKTGYHLETEEDEPEPAEAGQ